jgi:hypothetical protein
MLVAAVAAAAVFGGGGAPAAAHGGAHTSIGVSHAPIATVRVAQFRTMFVVGTSSIFITRVLIGCLPG